MATRRDGTPTATQRVQWAADREAKLADLHQRIVEQVGKLTDTQQWRSWLSFAANFHDYSFGNTVAIWMQRPDATWVAGFERWKTLGRQVRKGERGIAILAPLTGRTSPGANTGEQTNAEPAGIAPTGADLRGPSLDPLAGPTVDPLAAVPNEAPTARVLRGFRVVHVFDIIQTDGPDITVPTRPRLADVTPRLLVGQAPTGLWNTLVGIADEHGYTVRRGQCDGANGYTDYTRHLIKIRDDVDDAQATKTLIHEVAHVLLHTPTDFGSATSLGCRGQREVEAESVAYLVAAHHGMDTSAYTVGYVTGWAHRAAASEKKTPEDVVRATGQRVISTAYTITESTNAARGAGGPDPSPTLTARVHDGVHRTAALRRAAETAANGQLTPPDPAPGQHSAQARFTATAAAASRAFVPLRQLQPHTEHPNAVTTATTATVGRQPGPRR